MYKKRSIKMIFSSLPIVLFVALLAACGNSGSTTTGATASTPTASAPCLSLSTGTIQSVNNNTLLLTNLQGKSVQVMVTGATTFLRQATLTASGLKSGMLVSVVVKQNTDNTYSALTVAVRTSLARQGGFTNGTKLCGGQRRGKGTPGAGGFGGPASGSGNAGSGPQSRQTISGTVSQLNGNTLTVTDTSGSDFTVSLTSTTRITAQLSATVSDLQKGDAVTITGTANSQGVISASNVAILQGLPVRRQTPTPTSTGTSTPTTNA